VHAFHHTGSCAVAALLAFGLLTLLPLASASAPSALAPPPPSPSLAPPRLRTCQNAHRLADVINGVPRAALSPGIVARETPPPRRPDLRPELAAYLNSELPPRALGGGPRSR
jgi:hypothetical protein